VGFVVRGGDRIVMGRLQQRSWTAEDGSARSVVEVVAEELGPSLRWATATTTRTTRSQS
jgi:single-strand DNA-binding protein